MKSVIVTGASKGIGFATALAFAKAGYKVFATMRNLESAPALLQACKDDDLEVSVVEMNVDSDESVHQGITTISKEVETVDVLVNNAGIERHGSVEELSLSDFKSVMETNYFGVLRCIKAVLPQMRQNRKGCIINVSSISGQMTNTPLSAYTASKFALEAVSEALAGEVKPFDIRVALVQPGISNTQMAHQLTAGSSSFYPQVKRFAGLFVASVKTPIAPTLVADKILDIAESDSWQLSYPVGPDGAPFLGWRKAMSDEQWVDWNALNDEDWYNVVESTFGMNARQQ